MRISGWSLCLSALLSFGATSVPAAETTGPQAAVAGTTSSQTTEKSMKTVYDFTLKSIDGKDVSLADYKGKVLLIVNVASKCGFTGQYDGLEKIYDQYRDKDVVVLGFPANNFMGQEPGTDAEIKQFCTTKFDVSFPMFSKISVKGDDIHPLFQFLTSGDFSGDVSWNFNKFIIGRDGRVVARFGSRTKPADTELVAALDKALAEKP
ncbi:glutathione peroxidase [candidate division BRC1 bacterium HGW-BRC1-1]|jgi:glutathione peroxidase|nr:MAG: glutathione peroxidase [candidate division BRC1 bacterium HGW-BRC1-1]